MWLLLIILLCWLAWKLLNFSLKYVLPIALLLLVVAYAIKFWWIVALIGIGMYLDHRRKLSKKTR